MQAATVRWQPPRHKCQNKDKHAQHDARAEGFERWELSSKRWDPCKIYCEMTYTRLHIAVESLPLDLFEAQLPHHAAAVTVMLLVVMLLKLSLMVLSVMVLSVMVFSVRFLSVMLLSAVPVAFRRAAFVQGNGP